MAVKTARKVRIMTITPAMAKKWLDNNQNFRRLKSSALEPLIDEFENGRMRFNGESIKFNGREKLKDGQHRLTACVNTGVPFESVVVWGIEDDLTIDRGVNRSLVDVLVSKNIPNATSVAKACRTLHRFENRISRESGTRLKNHQVLLDMLKKYPNTIEITQHCHGPKKLVPIGFLAGIIAFSEGEFGSNAEYFVDGLTTGSDLQDKDPVLVLRNRLLRHANSINRPQEKLSSLKREAYTIIAWNAMVRGESQSRFLWAETGPNKQPFPWPVIVSELGES